MIKINLLIIFICLSHLCHTEDQGDWVDPNYLPLDFAAHPFYAGYLNIIDDQQFYYAYYPSEKNPSKDPLVVRVSGGPGCSSLYSFVYSKGPWIF